MTMWARLYATDGVLIEQRVEEQARSVCDADPRTLDERRADALAAAITHTDLACGCGHPDCARPARDTPAKTAVVYVVADVKSVDAATAQRAAQCSAPPAFVFGAGILPTALLGAVVERATIRTVRHPGDAPAEPRYGPSRSLADFVRCRDLTCRFPRCDKPAQFCDIDHTVPYPVGPTHPSNLKCLCRFHHLLKTFWGGVNGWRDRQLPDGTVIWTSPTGHMYTTYPGSRHLHPQLCAPTATLWTGQPPVVEQTAEHADQRGVMMPRRRHTREMDRARRIAAERRLNDDYAADALNERNKPPPY